MSQKSSRLGAVGEHLAIVQLLLHGWDAYDANASITNTEGIDVVCISEGKEVALVQVKTTEQNSFPTGLTLEKALDKKHLWEHILGPWVFVKVIGSGTNAQYKYYVLSRQQTIDMIYESNNWYVNQVQRTRQVNKKSVCAILEEWLEGKDYTAPRLKGAVFQNPLKGISSEKKWDNIWKK